MIEPQHEQVISSLQKVLPSANSAALDLVKKMISWNPRDRPTCYECLLHPFFSSSPLKSNPVFRQHRSSIKVATKS